MMKCDAQPDCSPLMAGPARTRGFNPYQDNGGSIVAIAGGDFVIIGSDTRLCSGFNILTRNLSKLFKLTKKTVLGSAGCWCDCLTFNKFLEARLKMYSYEHDQEMSTNAISQCCSTMLYSRRFFPYYVANVVAGLDDKGAGAVYHYDPVGNVERVPYTSSGSSSPIMMPLLDSIVGKKNQVNPDPAPISKDCAMALIKDVFVSAAERDIQCGDGLHIMLITKDGIQESSFELRKD